MMTDLRSAHRARIGGCEICEVDAAAALNDPFQIRTVDSDSWRVLDKTWSIERSTLNTLGLIGVMSPETAG